MSHFLKKSLRSIFKAFGFSITRRDTRRATLEGILENVKNLGFRPQTVIDVGAAFGTFELYEAFPEAKHLLVEPVREYEEGLKSIAETYKAEYVLAAAGSEPGTIEINVHPDMVGSSLYKEAEGSYVDGISRQVPMVTVDQLCRERNGKGPYLLKIDVQGAETEVIEGATEVLEETELVLLEVSLFQFFINGPQLYDIVDFMKERSYVVYDIFDMLYRPYDGALGIADLAFVKEGGMFRECHYYATHEQREQQFKRAARRMAPPRKE